MSTSEEKEPQASSPPPAKKVKTGWENHTLNMNDAIMKADESRHFGSLKDDPVQTLQGIGPVAEKVLQHLKVKTISDLASYKYFLLARALVNAAETEEDGERGKDSVMNVDKAVDKEYESKSFKEIIEAPVSAIEGLTKGASDLFEELKVKSIKDLATFKFCLRAESICVLADYEQSMNESERKKQRALNKLK